MAPNPKKKAQAQAQALEDLTINSMEELEDNLLELTQEAQEVIALLEDEDFEGALTLLENLEQKLADIKAYTEHERERDSE